MKIYDSIFPLGLGTGRFPITRPTDLSAITKSIQLVLRALEAGVNYIDIGYTYAAGGALPALREAFQQTTRPFSITAKVMYGADHTADDARRRVELYLKALGVQKMTYFTCWTIWNKEIFSKIMATGGIYDGARKLKDEGIVDHICASLHAPPKDAIEIISSGAFEGVTLSYSLLNAGQMQPVLDAAYKAGVGVVVMNPLGGGVIAQNRDYFSFACGPEDAGNTVHAALRFAKAHPAVDIVLGGVSTMEELEDSLSVFAAPDPEPPQVRQERVLANLSELKGFCTGCRYCAGCPQGIPTADIMKARNNLLFAPVQSYNRQEPERLLYHIQLFRPLLHDQGWMPESGENPCVRCGRCEKQCTQKLGIMDAVADTYRRAQEAGFTKEAHKARLTELLREKGYRRVGLYPNGGFSNAVMRQYQEYFGDPDFTWLLFNSNKNLWGQTHDGLLIHGPSEIPELAPDVLLVCSYRYAYDIFEDLEPYRDMGIRVELLHRDQDVPWVF